jgi:hypothetical protein
MSGKAQLCSGFGQYHTDKNGTPYESITLDEIFKMAINPTNTPKNDSQWVIFSEVKSRVASEQRADGRYHAVWSDIDEHCEVDSIKDVLAELGCKYLIHSSSRSKPEKKKWRVIVPLNEPANAENYSMIAQVLNDRFDGAGVVTDRASERPAQLCFLPNRDPFESEFYEQVAHHTTQKLDWRVQFKDELAQKRQQAQEQIKLAQQAKELSRIKATERVASGELLPIDAFKASYDLETVMRDYGYKKIGDKWISPNSQSGKAGVTILPDRRKWFSAHASDSTIGRSCDGGTSGDVFDLFIHYEHNGNEISAMKAAGSMFTTSEGITLTQSNQRRHMALQAGEDLAELSGVGTTSLANGWKSELLEAVQFVNQDHSLILIGSKYLVMKTWRNSEGRKERVFMSVRSFEDFYANRTVMTGTRATGSPVIEGLGKAWIKHPSRADFKDGICFEPSSYAGGIEVKAKITRDALNLWEGFSIEPKQADLCGRIYDHILNVVCNGDTGCNDYLLNWIARGFQYPSKNGQVATVLKGLKGSGKSTIGKLLGAIYGQHSLQVTNPKHLVGNFNGHLQDACFLFADECFFAGDRQHENVLKTLITEPTLMVERKGIDVMSAKNRLKLLMATNNDWAVPASRDERRYFVLDVSSSRIGDAQYFKELHTDIQNKDVQSAFLFDMLNRDLSKFIVGKIPETSGLQSQRLQSLDSFGKFWVDVLERGYLLEATVGGNDVYDFSAWINEPAVELINAGYQQWVAKQRLGKFDILSQTGIGNRLISWYGSKKRSRHRRIAGCDFHGNKILTGERAAYYSLGSLEDATKAFCDYEKVELSIG